MKRLLPMPQDSWNHMSKTILHMIWSSQQWSLHWKFRDIIYMVRHARFILVIRDLSVYSLRRN